MADADSRPLVLFAVKNDIATITYNRPERYNAWTMDMISALQEALRQCAEDPGVKAAILTGSGAFYCSGVDFAGAIRPMWPSRLFEFSRAKNQGLFEAYLDFPKPLFAAVNGPAMGAAVTSAALCDAMLADPSATFQTPFRSLGMTAEGCSSVNFPRLLGEANARVMLEEGRKIGAEEAWGFGLVTEVVSPPVQLMDRAQAFAEAWVASGRGRRLAEEAGWLDELRRANAEESVALARSFLQRPFLDAQYRFAAQRGKAGPQAIFWAARALSPLLSPLVSRL